MVEEPATEPFSLRAAIERLYENERLTDALTDQTARLLLNWGEQQLKQMAASAPNPAAIDQAGQQVQQVMRAVNRLAEDRAGLAEADFIQRLLELVERAGQQVEPVKEAVNRLAEEQAELSETDFIQRLLKLVERADQPNSNQQLERQETAYDQETRESEPENNP